jgi:hypothetical protein
MTRKFEMGDVDECSAYDGEDMSWAEGAGVVV